MADVHIPREAVDKAARVILKGFDDSTPIEQAHAREGAMDVLNAAAPLIVAAELDRMVERMPSKEERTGFAKCIGLDEASISTLNTAMDEIQVALRDRAKQLREQA